jgi:hypothetical protein
MSTYYLYIGAERIPLSGRVCDDIQVQDLDESCDLPAPTTTRIRVDDIPPSERNTSLIKYYLCSLMSCECEVKQYGKTFLATFGKQIGKFLIKSVRFTARVIMYIHFLVQIFRN